MNFDGMQRRRLFHFTLHELRSRVWSGHGILHRRHLRRGRSEWSCRCFDDFSSLLGTAINIVESSLQIELSGLRVATDAALMINASDVRIVTPGSSALVSSDNSGVNRVLKCYFHVQQQCVYYSVPFGWRWDRHQRKLWYYPICKRIAIFYWGGNNPGLGAGSSSGENFANQYTLFYRRFYHGPTFDIPEAEKLFIADADCAPPTRSRSPAAPRQCTELIYSALPTRTNWSANCVDITWLIFRDVKSLVNDGGATYQYGSAQLYVQDSTFDNCRVEAKADGAIAVTGNTAILEGLRCCFESCFAITVGLAIATRVSSAAQSVADSHFYTCSSSSVSGVTNIDAQLTFLPERVNFTDSDTISGSAAVGTRNVNCGWTPSYSTILNCSGAIVIRSVRTGVRPTVEFCNLYDNNASSNLIYAATLGLLLDHCVLFGNSKSVEFGMGTRAPATDINVSTAFLIEILQMLVSLIVLIMLLQTRTLILWFCLVCLLASIQRQLNRFPTLRLRRTQL
jgi:hypothetical protein